MPFRYEVSATAVSRSSHIDRKRLPRLIGNSFGKIVIANKVMKPYMDDDGILTMGLLDFLPDQGCLNLVPGPDAHVRARPKLRGLTKGLSPCQVSRWRRRPRSC